MVEDDGQPDGLSQEELDDMAESAAWLRSHGVTPEDAEAYLLGDISTEEFVAKFHLDDPPED